MRQYLVFIAPLLFITACNLEPGAERESLAQCAGNHRDDSLAIWFQRASNDGLNMPGVTVRTHPVRNCIVIGIQDSMQLADVEEELQRLHIPRNAAVIATNASE
jgi:hypothetical protein